MPLAFDTLEVLQANRPVASALLLCLGLLYVVRYYRSPWRHLPPGPPGIPVLGNLPELGHKQWETFTRLSKTYGPILHLNAGGQPIVVLNSIKPAVDLLERRAGIYSDRPQNIVGADMMCGGYSMVFAHFDDMWRRMRKASHEVLKKDIVKEYKHTQYREAILLASGLLESGPRDWDPQIRRASGSVILGMVYGMDPLKSINDPKIVRVTDFVQRITTATLPGNHLAEFFTWMKYIPAPFAKWKDTALKSFFTDSAMFGELFYAAQKKKTDHGNQSFAASLVEDSERHNLTETEKIWLAGTIYAAGADTVSATMFFWMLAMVANPDVQQKAHEEIDRIVGRDRLPTFEDMENLPYVQATVKETIRWRPPPPLGVPHRSIEDDWYEGYFIPKDSIVMANAWLLNRDPSVFGEDADDYNPSRFLGPDGRPASPHPDSKDHGHFTFGFGRRICVGRHMATNLMNIYAAMILWAMNLERVKDENGNLITLNIEECREDGLVIRPLPFDCRATPRFPGVLTMLDDAKELADLKKYVDL